MKKIHLIYTGGTIGGEKGAGIISDNLAPKKFVNALNENIPSSMKKIQLSYTTPVKKMSENFKPNDWLSISKEINKIITTDKNVNGIVIAHGTDTLAYTSAALSFLVQGTPIPIILTGANKPILEKNTDAIQNMKDAIFLACKENMDGIFVSFSGIKDKGSTVYLGCRIRKAKFVGNNFFCPNCKPIGKITNTLGKEKFSIINKELLDFVIKVNRDKKFEVFGEIDSRIAFFKVYPGFNPLYINTAINNNIHGIILELYNSGTACVEDGANSILNSIESATKKKIPVFITSQQIGRVEMDTYETSTKIKNVGGVPLKDMISETAITKLMWVLKQNQDYDEVKKIMLENIAGEISWGK